MADKQDSNVTGLSICEEASLGVLPVAADQHWELMDPNSYTDFGNEVTKVSRKTINPARKVKKGGVTDVAAVSGFVHDMLPVGLLRTMRGFFFTNGNEAGTSAPLNRDDTRKLTAVAATDQFSLSQPMTGAVVAGSIILADGFTEGANNGVHNVDSATTTAVDVSSSLVDETAPDAARIRAVGHRCTSGAIEATAPGDYLMLTNSDSNFDDMNISVGDTLFIGGDAAGTFFDTLGVGYARVVTVSAGLMLLKDFTGTVVADDGSGKTIEIYYPTVGFRDEPSSGDIVRRSYQMERTLGEDGDGPQAEYIKGSIPNEMAMTLPEADKIGVTFNYVAMDRELIEGAGTLKTVAAGATLYSPEDEDFVNTSTDIFVSRLVSDAGQENLVGYLESIDLTVNNGATPNKAVGVVGAFDFSVGDFTVTGSTNAYFDSVAVLKSIRDNDDVSVQIISARSNEGFAFAMPLVTLSGGTAQVDSDQPIMLPLEIMAAVGPSGVTLAYNFFAYLPTAAMPS